MLGGKFREMSKFLNYTHQFFNFRNRANHRGTSEV